jgi:ketosteroid isomerase-like protein
MGASAIHVDCMERITKNAVREIEQIHSSWIKFEVAGQGQSLVALCADDIELWPPDAHPLIGRSAVSAEITRATTSIHSIEISDLRIRGSNEIAYLTASYKTTFPRRKTRLLDKPWEAICGSCESRPPSGLFPS